MLQFGTWLFPILCLGTVQSLLLSEGTVAFVEKELSPLHVEVEATDGAVYIRAVGTNDTPNCTLTANQKAVKNLLNDRDATVIYIGTARKADACCRTHDQCPYFIGPFQAKYNYRNLYPWALSLCHCDRTLYHCFKDAHSGTADEVGEAFFGLLDMECFTFEKVKYCEKYHWTHIWCEEETTGPAAVVRKLGLDW